MFAHAAMFPTGYRLRNRRQRIAALDVTSDFSYWSAAAVIPCVVTARSEASRVSAKIPSKASSEPLPQTRNGTPGDIQQQDAYAVGVKRTPFSSAYLRDANSNSQHLSGRPFQRRWLER